jgi:FkbM family methyltransferase
MAGDVRMRSALKRVRQTPLVNIPLTYSVRGIARALDLTPEFAIKHLPRSGITKTMLPNGRSVRLWSRGDDWVSNQVFWRGWAGYDSEVAPLFWRLAVDAEVTLDIGAHVGFYTLLAAMANPRGRVLAMEPLPVVFARLERNIQINKLENVIALQQAAGAVDGTAEFFHVPGIIPSSSGLSEEFMRRTPGVTALTVDVGRLDTIAKTKGIDAVGLIKIDTETTEPDVLRGLGRLFESGPDIVCEVLTRADTAALASFLEPEGYHYYLLTDGGPVRKERIEPDPRWLNYLFTRRGPPVDPRQ